MSVPCSCAARRIGWRWRCEVRCWRVGSERRRWRRIRSGGSRSSPGGADRSPARRPSSEVVSEHHGPRPGRAPAGEAGRVTGRGIVECTCPGVGSSWLRCSGLDPESENRDGLPARAAFGAPEGRGRDERSARPMRRLPSAPGGAASGARVRHVSRWDAAGTRRGAPAQAPPVGTTARPEGSGLRRGAGPRDAREGLHRSGASEAARREDAELLRTRVRRSMPRPAET